MNTEFNQTSSKEQPKLDWHEWGAVIVYAALLSSIAIYTLIIIPYQFPEGPSKPHWLLEPNIEVYITGAVERPGQYTIRRGSTRADLLTLANPHQNADFKNLRTTVKLKEGELVEIPAKQMVTVRIEGEIQNPTTIIVEKGTKVTELQRHIKLKPGADPASLNKKRPIKDGEIIKVKKKKAEKDCAKTELFVTLFIQAFPVKRGKPIYHQGLSRTYFVCNCPQPDEILHLEC